MSISDFTNLTGEIRIRLGAMYQQIPNNVQAGEALQDGQFVYLSTGGRYYLASPTECATHLVLKSGVPRVSCVDIQKTGSVETGEPVMAVTGGPGTVEIPVAASVVKGIELTVNAEGWATPRTALAGYCIGYALEDVTVTGATPVMCECFITLPAKYQV